MRGPDGRLRTSLDQLLPCFPRAGLRPASSAAHAPRRAALRLPSRRAPRAAPASALWLASGLRANLPGLGRQVGYLPQPRCPSWARTGRALVGLGPILAAWESPSEARTKTQATRSPTAAHVQPDPPASRHPSGGRHLRRPAPGTSWGETSCVTGRVLRTPARARLMAACRPVVPRSVDAPPGGPHLSDTAWLGCLVPARGRGISGL